MLNLPSVQLSDIYTLLETGSMSGYPSLRTPFLTLLVFLLQLFPEECGVVNLQFNPSQALC